MKYEDYFVRYLIIVSHSGLDYPRFYVSINKVEDPVRMDVDILVKYSLYMFK